MRVLFVAMAESIHTARWISQLLDQGWDLHLFPSIDSDFVHGALRGVTVHRGIHSGTAGTDPSVGHRGLRVGSRLLARAAGKLQTRLDPLARAKRLAALIDELRPDVVHSMELQNAGYLALDARQYVSGPFPPWIVHNWGNEIFYFGRFPEHDAKLRRLLEVADYYGCECERDIRLARDLGFKGDAFPVFPISGGFDLDRCSALRSPGPTSARRIVMVKGYQGWAGRALNAVEALRRCKDVLDGYELVFYVTVPEVAAAAEDLRRLGLRVRVIPGLRRRVFGKDELGLAHDDVLRLHGQARASIGISVSDGASTSALEAMIMGSFPIQSDTACTAEYFTQGEGGMSVPTDDIAAIEAAVRRALTDDALVDRAADLNLEVARKRLSLDAIKPEAISWYPTAAGRHPVANPPSASDCRC